MSNPVCIICQGNRRVRLPAYHPVDAITDPRILDAQCIQDAWREYPCPECQPQAPFTKMGTIKVMSFRDAFSMSEATKEWWRENAAKNMGRMIAERLIMDGFIQFEKLEPEGLHDEGIMATIRAIMPRDVATFEERVAERQMEVAAEVAKEATAGIENWGSYFGHTEIWKADAYRLISQAVSFVRDKRARKK